MKKEFEAKLMQERIIDTKQYRYIVTEEHDETKQWAEIKRLPISDLDTTKAIDGWATIKRIYLHGNAPSGTVYGYFRANRN